MNENIFESSNVAPTSIASSSSPPVRKRGRPRKVLPKQESTSKTTPAPTPTSANPTTHEKQPKERKNCAFTLKMEEHLLELRLVKYKELFSDINDNAKLTMGWNRVLVDFNDFFYLNLTMLQLKNKFYQMRNVYRKITDAHLDIKNMIDLPVNWVIINSFFKSSEIVDFKEYDSCGFQVEIKDDDIAQDEQNSRLKRLRSVSSSPPQSSSSSSSSSPSLRNVARDLKDSNAELVVKLNKSIDLMVEVAQKQGTLIEQMNQVINKQNETISMLFESMPKKSEV